MTDSVSPQVPILINGEPVASISALDRGLHYGDGLFETLAISNGMPVHWERHLQRLLQACDRLGFAAPDTAALTREAQHLCAGQARAVLKLIITRGVGGRGYRPAPAAQPTRIMTRYPWPDHPVANVREGVVVRFCSTRLGTNPALAGMKHLNRLEQVMARAEWTDATIGEGLMCDQTDHVIEGTMSNLFLVSNGQLITPELSQCGVAGITRGLIIEWAVQQGMRCDVRPVSRDELFSADELFLCNSIIGVWPVRALEAQRYVPGVTTRALIQALEFAHG